VLSARVGGRCAPSVWGVDKKRSYRSLVQISFRSFRLRKKVFLRGQAKSGPKRIVTFTKTLGYEPEDRVAQSSLFATLSSQRRASSYCGAGRGATEFSSRRCSQNHPRGGPRRASPCALFHGNRLKITDSETATPREWEDAARKTTPEPQVAHTEGLGQVSTL
jgi:hypothetical protein